MPPGQGKAMFTWACLPWRFFFCNLTRNLERSVFPIFVNRSQFFVCWEFFCTVWLANWYTISSKETVKGHVLVDWIEHEGPGWCTTKKQTRSTWIGFNISILLSLWSCKSTFSALRGGLSRGFQFISRSIALRESRAWHCLRKKFGYPSCLSENRSFLAFWKYRPAQWWKYNPRLNETTWQQGGPTQLTSEFVVPVCFQTPKVKTENAFWLHSEKLILCTVYKLVFAENSWIHRWKRHIRPFNKSCGKSFYIYGTNVNFVQILYLTGQSCAVWSGNSLFVAIWLTNTHAVVCVRTLSRAVVLWKAWLNLVNNVSDPGKSATSEKKDSVANFRMCEPDSTISANLQSWVRLTTGWVQRHVCKVEQCFRNRHIPKSHASVHKVPALRDLKCVRERIHSEPAMQLTPPPRYTDLSSLCDRPLLHPIKATASSWCWLCPGCRRPWTRAVWGEMVCRVISPWQVPWGSILVQRHFGSQVADPLQVLLGKLVLQESRTGEGPSLKRSGKIRKENKNSHLREASMDALGSVQQNITAFRSLHFHIERVWHHSSAHYMGSKSMFLHELHSTCVRKHTRQPWHRENKSTLRRSNISWPTNFLQFSISRFFISFLCSSVFNKFNLNSWPDAEQMRAF